MERNNQFNVDLTKASKENIFYNLVMFPYPSGAGLHVGHAMNYTASDIVARFKRMQGYTVLNPIGWDSFGLPTEGYAMKVGKPAAEVTKENINNFVEECELMDWSYDRSREFATSDPVYYKWTQRIFQQLFKKGLAYRKEAFVNWCPFDQTVLANDQVVDGKCERCGTEVVQKKHMQWFFKITDYADRLINDLDTVEWPEETKTQQKYWIGKSEGAEITFNVDEKTSISVFTTRPDTLYGVTALVLAPENETIDSLLTPDNKKKLEEYRKATGKKSALERQQDAEERSGIFSGVSATHPLTNEQIPVWFADYVLPDYATGAVMCVPAHDERDWNFADKHQIKKVQVVKPIMGEPTGGPDELVIKDSGYAIIFDPKTNKYLCIITKSEEAKGSNGHYSFPGGTIENGESIKEWTLREVEEETGYTNFADLSSYVFSLKAFYHSKWKKEHRDNDAHFFLWELVDDTNKWQNLMDYENEFITKWLSKEEIENNETYQMRKDAFKYTFSAYSGQGILINSAQFDWLDNEEAKWKITEYLEQQWLGRKKTTYKLRDRSVSRQRYRGCPIPVYYDENGNPQLIPEEELPVILPLDLGNYKPAGKSPLADHPTFPHYTAKDGKTYMRECDTIDTFMDSAFYYLRFIDPNNEKELISKELAEKTLPVDFYMGGREHTYGHLLYSRFIHKFLFDEGIVASAEPFQRLFHQGFVLAADGRKMSKRWGNVITPGDLVNKYGKERGMDILRTYVMFMWPVEAEKNWNDNAVDGVKRFLERVERMDQFIAEESPAIEPSLHKTIKWMTEDVEKIKFNTAVSKLMVFVNDVYDKKSITKNQFSMFLQLLAPFATRLTQQWWEKLGNEGNIHFSNWPAFDAAKIAADTINLPVQLAGKMKGTLEVATGLSQNEIMAKIQADERFAGLLADKEITKIIYVQDKIINIIIK